MYINVKFIEIIVWERNMLEVIANRHSLRTYTDEKIEWKKIKVMLGECMQVSSYKNSNYWEFTVEDKDLLHKLSKLHYRSSHISCSNICIAVLGNRDRFIKVGKWVQGLGSCTQNILLEATNQGLASCLGGVFPKTKRVDYVREVLNILENLVPYALIPLGYSDEEFELVNRFNKYKIHINLYEK